MIEIPHHQIKMETLENLVKEFILAESTGCEVDFLPLEEKIAQVKNALSKGKAAILYNPDDESCFIKFSDF